MESKPCWPELHCRYVVSGNWSMSGYTCMILYSGKFSNDGDWLNIWINASPQFRVKATYKKKVGLLQFYSNIFDKGMLAGFIQLQGWIEPVGLLWGLVWWGCISIFSLFPTISPLTTIILWRAQNHSGLTQQTLHGFAAWYLRPKICLLLAICTGQRATILISSHTCWYVYF